MQEGKVLRGNLSMTTIKSLKQEHAFLSGFLLVGKWNSGNSFIMKRMGSWACGVQNSLEVRWRPVNRAQVLVQARLSWRLLSLQVKARIRAVTCSLPVNEGPQSHIHTQGGSQIPGGWVGWWRSGWEPLRKEQGGPLVAAGEHFTHYPGPDVRSRWAWHNI